MRNKETTLNDEKIKVAVIAAGVRGSHLAQQVKECSKVSARVVAVAEPNEERRVRFGQMFGIENRGQFATWEELCGSDLQFDAAIIATMDNQHDAPVLACLRRGCHVMVEKPLADSFGKCLQIAREQKRSRRVVSVCHTLRYVDAFRRMKEIVRDGVLGRLMYVEHMEAIDHFRFSHNYVRGRWAREKDNTSLLLHKCCHDIDFMAWLVDSPCERVSSFGSLAHFTPSHAPEGSGKRCLGDCKLKDSCPYSALRLYVDGDLTGRLMDVSENQSREARLAAVEKGPFGVCVWRAGNDVVDHQVVSMEFAGGTTATCTMTGYSSTHGRRTRLQGTKGELFFDEARRLITLKLFSKDEAETIQLSPPSGYHPEDREIITNWLSAIGDSSTSVAVNAQEAMRTLMIVFAAEQSRCEKRVVEMTEFDAREQ